MFPRSGLLLADSKSNSSTRLPRRTTTRVSSGWEASMIILLAMANSLAARQNSPRGPNGPPDCAARGVYVGDGENWKLGNERRRFDGLTICDRSAKNRPRRTDCGPEVLVSRWEHRHPKTRRTRLVATQAAPHGVDVTIQDAPPRIVRQVDSLLSARDLPAQNSRRRIALAIQPAGRQPAPTLSAQAAGRRMTVPANASLNQQASRPRGRGPNS